FGRTKPSPIGPIIRLGSAPGSKTIPAERTRRLLRTAVDIVEPHDVVFAEIASGLHLDQFEWDFSLVREPVDAADRDEDRLILMHSPRILVDRDFRGAAHHDPVLGTVAVLLQREHAFGIDDDALDLEALAHVDGLIISPRAVHARMVDR